MRSNRLQLNAVKTKILCSATSRRLRQLPQAPLRVSSDFVTPSAAVRDRNSSQLTHVDEFPRQEDSVNMFCCAEAASSHSLFSVQTRGSVTGDVTYPQSSPTVTRHWPVFLNIFFGDFSQ